MDLRVWSEKLKRMVDTTLEDISKEVGFEYNINQNVWDFTQAVAEGAKTMLPIGLEDTTGTKIYTQDIIEQFGCEFEIQECKGGYQCVGLTGKYKGQSFTIDFVDQCTIVGNMNTRNNK